jgi:dihydroorotase
LESRRGLVPPEEGELYDLVLKGGTVVDPSQEIHKVLDVAVRAGTIAGLRPDIPADQACEILDVSRKLVTPGLVDLHSHVYWGGTGLGVLPDRVASETGVTTFVDAGSAGAGNFLGFKEHVIERSRARIYAFLHIAYPGLTAAVYAPESFAIVGETFDLRHAMLIPAIEVGRAFPGLIRGIKVRLSVESSGDQGLKPLRLALQAAEALGVPVMVHVGPPPPSTPEVLALLRKGDILTHLYRGEPNCMLDREGRVRRELVEARARGVIMDVGHGGGSFAWSVAQRALQQDFMPDVLSSDIHRGLKVKTTRWSGMPAQNQPATLSKFLSLGLSLDKVILASTLNPARAIGLEDQVGSLREGFNADIAVFQVEEGEFEFSDSFDGKMTGSKRLRPLLTLIGGKVLSRHGE